MKLFYFVLLAILISSCTQDVPDALPNIVLIITDDQGYGDLKVHGNKHINTPNLDKLSEESVRFSNFHANTTCAPTRASLMTGQHCNVVGVWHTIIGRSFLNTSHKTMPEYLKDLGYSTAMFGKWHLGDNYSYRPQERGFDETVAHGGGGVGQTPDYWNNDYFDDTYFHNGKPKKYSGYCTDVWFEESIKYITNTAQKDQPFFAYISTNAPHGPYHIMDEYSQPYKGNPEIPNANFNGMITNIDDNVGTLRNEIKNLGLEDNTIFIYMTDNGTSSGIRFGGDDKQDVGYNAGMRGKKGSEYEGGHRVPLFIDFPEKMEIPITEYSDMTSVMDILPTLLDLLGKDGITELGMEGVSFKELLLSGKQESLNGRIVVADKQRIDRPVKWKNTSVMQANWRLVNQNELYDIGSDPGQKANIFNDYPEKVIDLKNAYEAWWSKNAEAFQQNNYIPIGVPEEPIALLTAHDWITSLQVHPPWHQTHVRNAKIFNGHWLVDVKAKGEYKVRLFRYPPSLDVAMEEDIPQGDIIEGGKPFVPGKGIKVKDIKLTIQDHDLEQTKVEPVSNYEFKVQLNTGVSELKTWLIDEEGIERGAYFVEVELISD